MKRMFLFLVTMTSIVTIFGCGKNEATNTVINGKNEYTAAICSDCEIGIPEPTEKSLNITFMDKEYEMEYKRMRTLYFLPYIMLEYRDGKNSILLVEDTDKIVDFTSELYYGNIDKRNTKLSILPEDELKRIADDYAKKVINIEEYQVEVVNNKEYSAYEYIYTRFIAGYETSDYLVVTLSDRGELLEYRDSQMRDIKYISLESFDKEKAYDAVKEILKEQLPNAYIDTFETQEEILTLTEDNEIAFYYLATVVIDKEGGYREAIPVRLIWQ